MSDYEAAWDAGAELFYGTTWNQLGDAEREYVANVVKTLVDAAHPPTKRETAIRWMVDEWEMIGEREATKLVDGVLAAMGENI